MLDEKTVTGLTDWLLGPPLKIVLIVIAAMILNRMARRAVKRSLTRLHTGAVRERMGAMRRRTPAALLETGGNMRQHWSRALLDVEVAYDKEAAGRGACRRRRARPAAPSCRP